MKEGIIKDTYELIIKEIQTILTLAYLLMVGIGMVFNYFKYSQFGINIFQYADIFDFLIAPFEDLTIILFAFVSALIPFLLFQLDSFWKKRFPRSYSIASFGLDKTAWFNNSRPIVYILILVLYVIIAADIHGKEIKKNIKSYPQLSLKYVDNQVKTGIQLGKTKEVIFLLEGKKLLIIPFNSVIKEIKMTPSAAKVNSKK